MDTLETIYARLAKNPEDRLSDIKLYRSEIHYVRAHLNCKFGLSLTLEETHTLLEEEDMLPKSSEIDYTVEAIYKELMEIINAD